MRQPAPASLVLLAAAMAFAEALAARRAPAPVAALSPAQRASRTDAVLDAWAGEGAPTASEIGAPLRMTRNAVLGVVTRARRAGDPRAVVRGSPLRPAVRPEPEVA